MSRGWHWVYVVAGFLCLLAFGLIAGAYLEHRDAPPPQLAPPEPPVLAVGVTCDELKVWQQQELVALHDAALVQGKQASALAVIAYTLAHATCRP